MEPCLVPEWSAEQIVAEASRWWGTLPPTRKLPPMSGAGQWTRGTVDARCTTEEAGARLQNAEGFTSRHLLLLYVTRLEGRSTGAECT